MSSTSKVNNVGKRVALITGSNRGIGQAIARSLVQKPDWVVLMGSRSGKASIHDTDVNGEADKNYKDPVPKDVDGIPIKLDIDDDKSVNEAVQYVKEKYGGLDVLVQNAAIAYKGDAWGEDVAKQTMKTNYYGAKRVVKAFAPIMRPGSRVVVVSSYVANTTVKKLPKALKDEFLALDLTESKLDNLVESFIKDVKDDTFEKNGWPKTTYGVSKAAISAFTRIFARDFKNMFNDKDDVLINACCPGYVNTLMTSNKGELTPDQGAKTPVMLATLPKGGKSGSMWKDEKEVGWE